MFRRLMTWELRRAMRRRQQLFMAAALPLALYLIDVTVNQGETVGGSPSRSTSWRRWPPSGL